MDEVSKHLIDSIREDLKRAYDKEFLETVTGPDIYGDGNFETYLEGGRWEIRPIKGWKAAELRGIVTYNRKEEF